MKLLPTHFLYAQSQDNYVQVFFLKGAVVKSELFRTTLKRLEQSMKDSPYLKRAHRGYLVNPTKVEQHLKKNQKQWLVLDHNIEIPVSASYLDQWPL
ncbi:MAG: LytTR family DNA-binding domain-containing protein [Bacteroidota bacterium]